MLSRMRSHIQTALYSYLKLALGLKGVEKISKKHTKKAIDMFPLNRDAMKDGRN